MWVEAVKSVNSALPLCDILTHVSSPYINIMQVKYCHDPINTFPVFVQIRPWTFMHYVECCFLSFILTFCPIQENTDKYLVCLEFHQPLCFNNTYTFTLFLYTFLVLCISFFCFICTISYYVLSLTIKMLCGYTSIAEYVSWWVTRNCSKEMLN